MSHRPGFTQDEINKNFDRCLSAAIDLGQFSGTDLGLDDEVMKAIDAVADSYPDIDERLIRKAKQVFASRGFLGRPPPPDPAIAAGIAKAAARYRR